MKSTRAITIGLTFVAGLYFILDFIVPPTFPGASFQGVVATTTPASMVVRSGTLPPVTYPFLGQGNMRPQILLAERDVEGLPKLTDVPLRQVGPGTLATVRIGPFAVKSVDRAAVVTAEGMRVSLSPGQKWIEGASNEPVAVPRPEMSLLIEQADSRVVRTDPGSIELIENGKRVVHHLGNRTVVMKLSRYGSGSEVQLDEAKAGDTIQIGPATFFADNRDAAAQFNLVVTTMAFGIGLLSLGMVHSRILIERRPGWSLSVFFFAAVILGVTTGIGKYANSGSQMRAFSDFVVLRIISSVSSAVFSLLAFYMAAAAYRAFRVRTGEAALMMTSALIVMIGQTPFGFYMTSWMGERYSALWLPNIAAWIFRVPNTAVFRGLVFGIMLGAIATALRYWLSMERSAS